MDRVLDAYELRPDELSLLEAAARTEDTIGQLQAALEEADLMTVGSAGQPRANPLLAELRGERTILNKLLISLRLPADEVREASEGLSRSTAARKAARARWAR